MDMAHIEGSSYPNSRSWRVEIVEEAIRQECNHLWEYIERRETDYGIFVDWRCIHCGAAFQEAVTWDDLDDLDAIPHYLERED